MTKRQEGSTRLVRGELASLGLYKYHPFYMAWVNMKTRCDNPNSTQYPWYGGRGITYDPAWKVFRNFYNDMWYLWERGYELDREDNSKNYNHDNCRWTTHKANCNNRRLKGTSLCP
jgi:hypothetical protein